MTDVSFTDLVLRMVLSLAIVLAIVLGAYAILRRRQGLGGNGGARFAALLSRGSSKSSRRNSLIRPARTSRMPGAKRGLRVVGRVGIGRTTQVVAVQFAEKVFLLGASEQNAPTVLAELELAAWLEATEHPDDPSSGVLSSMRDRTAMRADATGQPGVPGRTGGPGRQTPTSLLEALRDATLRRG